MRIENFHVAFDASRASLVSKIMKRRISIAVAIIGACSIAFAREPLSDEVDDRLPRMRSDGASSTDIHRNENAMRLSTD